MELRLVNHQNPNKGTKTMKHRLAAVIVAALAVVSVFAFTTTAQAGTYVTTSNFCDFTPSSDGFNYGISGGCNSGFGILEQTGHTPLGTWQWWLSTALPSTLNLNTAVYTASWDNGRSSGDSYPFETRICSIFGGYGTSGPSPCSGSSIDYWNNAHNSGPMDRSNSCPSGGMTAPGQAQTCRGFLFARFMPTGTIDLGGAQLSNLRLTIADFTAPVVSTTLANYPISQGNWLRGTVGTGATATDTNGSGMTSMALSILDDLPHSVTSSKSCYYGNQIPCSTSTSFSSSFNTTGVSDGPHTARYTATDAGSMTGATSNFSFKVDNTKPDTPAEITPQTSGENGWSSSNSFGATWTNGAEVDENTTQSGIDKVIVDVNPTNPGTQSDPAPVTVPVGSTVSGITAAKDSITGASVPAIGQWVLRIQLVDKAGNVSDVGDGSGGGVDSDSTIGYDPSAPAKPAGQANGWISRKELADGYSQIWSYTAPPTGIAPLCGWAGKVSEVQGDDPGTAKNVPGDGATRSWLLPANLAEGQHYVNLRAISCAGVASPGIESVGAPVDLTDPTPSYSGVEPGKWYKNGKTATIGGSDDLSGMAGEPDLTKLYSRGAYIAYSVNGTGPADADVPRGSQGEVAFTGDGQKTLSFSPVDLAGNEAKPTVVTFGIDGSLPHGYFADMDRNRPTLLRTVVADDVSGVDYAVIAIRRQGTDNWQNLPTSLVDGAGNPTGSGIKSGVASARFPDTSLPKGTYDVRTSIYDLAGNVAITSKYQDGSSVSVTNPMREVTTINAKLFKALRACGKKHCVVKKCTKKTKGTCYKVYKGKVVLVGGSTTVSSAYNRGAMINGVLAGEDGKPLKNQPVVISTVEKVSGKSTIVGTTTTDSNGLYGLRVPAGMNRSVTATYAGTELRQDVATHVTMNTQAKLKLKISKRRARTGQTVTFSGRVTSWDGKYPVAGKIVELQFFALKKWRPAVGVGHTDKNGKFKIKYKFDGRRVKAKINFRVAARTEDNWGHAFSTSKTAVIRVNY